MLVRVTSQDAFVAAIYIDFDDGLLQTKRLDLTWKASSQQSWLRVGDFQTYTDDWLIYVCKCWFMFNKLSSLFESWCQTAFQCQVTTCSAPTRSTITAKTLAHSTGRYFRFRLLRYRAQCRLCIRLRRWQYWHSITRQLNWIIPEPTQGLHVYGPIHARFVR